MSYTFIFRKGIGYAFQSIEYLDVDLGCYADLETDLKPTEAVDYFESNYSKTLTKEMTKLRNIMIDEITRRFFSLFEDQIYRAIFDEEVSEEIHIERYITACRKTRILEVDPESAALKQRVVFNMICVFMKRKLYSPSSSILINFLKTFCTKIILGYRIYADEEYMKHLDHILEQCKRNKYKLWGAWPSYKLDGEPYNPVITYLFMKNLSYIKLMYKYGIDYAFSMEIYKLICIRFCHIQ